MAIRSYPGSSSIPQLGIKHMHGAVHISLREGRTILFSVLFASSSHNWVSKGWRKAWFSFFARRHMRGSFGDGRLQRSSLGVVARMALVSPAPSVSSQRTTPLLPAMPWAEGGRSRWRDTPVLGGTTAWSYSSNHQHQLLLRSQRHSQSSSRGAARGIGPIQTSREALLWPFSAARRGVAAGCRTMWTNCKPTIKQLQSARPPAAAAMQPAGSLGANCVHPQARVWPTPPAFKQCSPHAFCFKRPPPPGAA